MELETLKYEVEGHVAILTYNRPDQHNAINRKMNAELQYVLPKFRDDKDAFVLVICSAGKNFCAGWDLVDAQDWKVRDWDEFRNYVYNSPGECGYTRKADIHKPIIAAVQGYAVAAGLETAMLADIRIADENAVFGALERRWNIVGGDGLTVRLPLIVGYARAMEMIITGREVHTDEALQFGLVNEVVPNGTCRDRALTLAHEIAKLPQGAIRTDKETVNRNIGRTLEERFRNEVEATLSMSMRRDTQDIGARAFKEKKKPVWPHHGL